jgi:chromosome segregation ATPase
MAFLTYKNKSGKWEYFEAPNTVKTVEQKLSDEQKTIARKNINLETAPADINNLKTSVRNLENKHTELNSRIEYIEDELPKRSITYISDEEPESVATIGSFWICTNEDIKYGEDVKL